MAILSIMLMGGSMSLVCVRSTCEALVSPACVEALRAGVVSGGSALLLVPGFDVALRAQKTLARCEGLGMAVEVTTPTNWVQTQWDLWGDGRTLVTSTMRPLLVAEALEQCSGGDEDFARKPGVVRLLCDLASQLPPLPLEGLRTEQDELTEGELRVVRTLEAYGALLARRGLIEPVHAMGLLPGLLNGAGVVLPSVVLAGFVELAHAERGLVLALARRSRVVFVGRVFASAADQMVVGLTNELLRMAQEVDVPVERMDEKTSSASNRAPELSAALFALFEPDRPRTVPSGAVRLVEPAGPLAEAELIVREILRQVDAGASEAVVCASQAYNAWQALAPKLVARGVSVRAELRLPVLQTMAGRAFMGYVRTVARLAELASDWPEPVQTSDGLVYPLGDMAWWPPKELVDFLLSDVSHVDVHRAQALDIAWRSNRLLSPADVLAQLLSAKATSDAVERATRELLKGRLGSAASKLLAPYKPVMRPKGVTSLAREETIAALAAVLDVAGTLKELGMTADPSAANAVSLSTLVDKAELVLAEKRVVVRPFVRAGEGAPTVYIMDRAHAASCEPCSVDVLVLCGLTSVDYAPPSHDDVRHAILESLRIEPASDPLDSQRSQFARLCALPRRALLVERPLFGVDAKETYPAIMLTELMECYDGELPRASRAEGKARANVSARGEDVPALTSEPIDQGGHIDDSLRRLVSVPQEGTPELAGWLPVLSASQLESYLECPLKWFSLRRLRLGDNDAGFGPLEMGTFAHRVLELTHAELLAEALETSGIAPDEAYDISMRLPGSRVEGDDPASLEHARATLERVFDKHYGHQRMRVGGRALNQALLPHTSREEGQVDNLKRDLLSTLDYEATRFAGFEPRFFEWKFGEKDRPVSYAGVRVTGTVDRIDVNAHGQALVIDYKHKGPTGFFAEYAALPEGGRQPGDPLALPRRIQSLLYAQVVRQAFPKLEVVGALYLGTRGSHDLSGAVAEGQADLVFGGKLSSRRSPRVVVPAGDTFGLHDSSGMAALLDATEQAVATHVERLREGRIAADPVDASACAYCPVLNCERRTNA